MQRRALAAAAVAICSCGSFTADDPAAPAPDASLPSPDGGGTGDAAATADGSAVPDAGDASNGCSKFEEDFESWPAAGGWQMLQNGPASIATVTGWSGRALQASFPIQTQGTFRAQSYRSFARTGACPLDISFTVRLNPTTDAARWTLLAVRGSAGGVVQIDHSGSFWYLRAGNTQTQIAAPASGAIGRMRLVITPVGSHVEAKYTLDGASDASANDLGTTLGDQADLLLGSEVAGATTSAILGAFDELRVEW